MENYGFVPIRDSEAQQMGFPKESVHLKVCLKLWRMMLNVKESKKLI